MSKNALEKYKNLVDRIDTAFRIGPTEGEAVLDDCGPRLEFWMSKMSKTEQQLASKYLDQVSKQHKTFMIEMGEDYMQDDIDDDKDLDEEDVQECQCPRCKRPDISTDRRRELTKYALELAEQIDGREITQDERAFLMSMLDNLIL